MWTFKDSRIHSFVCNIKFIHNLMDRKISYLFRDHLSMSDGYFLCEGEGKLLHVLQRTIAIAHFFIVNYYCVISILLSVI